MKLPILAALALSACTTAPIRECDTHVRGMWLDEACNLRDGAARPAKPTHVTPEPPKETPHVDPEPPHVDPPKEPPHVTPTDDKEPDRATDPEGHKAWKERHHGVKP